MLDYLIKHLEGSQNLGVQLIMLLINALLNTKIHFSMRKSSDSTFKMIFYEVNKCSQPLYKNEKRFEALILKIFITPQNSSFFNTKKKHLKLLKQI